MKYRHFWLPAGVSALILVGAGMASAQSTVTCAANANPYTQYPNPLQNGQTADATQVTEDLTCAPVYGLANWKGAIGIGTTSPAAKLDVNGWAIVRGNLSSQTPNTGLYMWAQDNGSFGAIEAHNPGNTVKYPLVLNAWGGNVGIGTSAPGQQLTVWGGGGVSITAQSGAQYLLMGNQDSAGVNDPAVIWAANGEFFFGRGSSWQGVGGTITNTMYLTRSGYVGIGTISPAATLHVNGSTILSQGFSQTSDARLKRDVRPLTGALALVAKMQGVRYNWKPVAERPVGKDLNLPLNEPQVGFLAQDLEKVLPEAVKAPKPGTSDTYSVEETKVVPVLVEAIKEQQAQMKRQQSEIVELRQEIAQLKADRK